MSVSSELFLIENIGVSYVGIQFSSTLKEITYGMAKAPSFFLPDIASERGA